MALVVTLEDGQPLMLTLEDGRHVEIKVRQVSARTSVRIDAPRSIIVRRGERRAVAQPVNGTHP